MRPKLKEDPKEWRKSVLLTALGLTLMSSLLRWRKVLPPTLWLEILAALAVFAGLAVASPRWFRGYYRVSMRLGFALSQVVARVVLVIIFALLITPLALLFRLAGKDPLRLKRPKAAESYWSPAKPSSPLDRMF